MILRWHDEPEVLLMRRSEHPEDRWSGQISLPGGHRDRGDRDLCATAVRESLEEVCVDLGRSARLLGTMARVEARARGKLVPLDIEPYVFGLLEEVAPCPGVEADEVFWFPLARAGSGELNVPYRYQRDDGLLVELPSWRHEGRVVWGLTHRMLSGLIPLLTLPS